MYNPISLIRLATGLLVRLFTNFLVSDQFAGLHVIIVDDNLYYRSMRREYFPLAKQSKTHLLLFVCLSPLSNRQGGFYSGVRDNKYYGCCACEKQPERGQRADSRRDHKQDVQQI